MNDLDGQKQIVSKVETGISRDENDRNRKSKAALQILSTKEKPKTKNETFEEMIDSLRTFVPNSILTEAVQSVPEVSEGGVRQNVCFPTWKL